MKDRTVKTSIYWRVRVHATQEEEIFDTLPDAQAWAKKVTYTFNDRTMKFDIIEVIEKTQIYHVKEGGEIDGN